jgi:uncharacterized membrane protein YcaP (DUF421 family)
MNSGDMFFQNWEGITRTLIVGVLAYVTLVLFLRVSGKRTLAKLNAFDFVVTIALGSTLSAILLQESIALAEGGTALALLISLQYLVTSLSVRPKRIASLARSEPSLLAKDGVLCRREMRPQRVTSDEVVSAIRSAGGSDVASVESDPGKRRND